MPDKKYLIEIPGMPEGSGVWDSDKWERNKDAFMSDYPAANVFELGEYDAENTNENDQIMLTFENDPDSSGVWDSAKWERNKEAFTADHPEAKVNRVRYVDYWSDRASAIENRLAELEKPDEGRAARLAEIGYFDDNENAVNLDGNLKPVSQAMKVNSVSGDVEYLDPAVEEFFANDDTYTERQLEKNQLKAEYDANPSVIAQREWEAQRKEAEKAYRNELKQQITAEYEANVDKNKAARGGIEIDGVPIYGPASFETEKQEKYLAALQLLDFAERMENGEKFWEGVGYGTTKAAVDYDGKEMIQVGLAFKKLEDRGVNILEATEEEIDEALDPEDKALMRAYLEYEKAMYEAEPSNAFKGGAQFGETIPFILEFIATGNIYKAGAKKGMELAGKKAIGKGFAKWIAKSAGKKIPTLMKRGVAKASTGTIKALSGTLTRTLASPTTYTKMATPEIQISEQGDVSVETHAAREFFDHYIENLSEISGEGMVAGLGGAAKLLKSTKIGKMPFMKLGEWFGNKAVWQGLSKLGAQSLPIEVAEEIVGNALRYITGVDKEALGRMFEKDEFASMLIGFAPLTVLGMGTSAASMGAVNIGAARAAKRMRETLNPYYTEEQIDNVIGSIEGAKTSDEVVEALRPIMVGMYNATPEEKTAVMDYGISVAKKKAMISARNFQEMQLSDASVRQIEDNIGKFWIENEDKTRTVRQVNLNDGRQVYIVSQPNEVGEVATVEVDTGKKGMAKLKDIKEEIFNSSLESYGTRFVMADRKAKEQERMANERQEQINLVRQNLAAQKGKINLGTEGSPIMVIADAENEAGVRYVAENGSTGNLSWDAVADAMGTPIRVFTDSQIVEQEIADIVARDAERKAQRAQQKGDNAVAASEAVAEASETVDAVAQETKHIPLNEDGTVNEAAFWEQDPEGYAQWNDEQNQDSGADTIQQIEAAKAELTAMLNEAQQATLTSNPANRKAAKREVGRLAERLARLEALEQSYADRALAPLRERAKMWADLTGAPVHVIETEEELAAISATVASENAKPGSRVRGFAKDGKAYIFLPGIQDVREIDEVFFHEAVAHNGLKGLLGKENYDKLCEQVWNMMSPTARNQFIRYPGVNGDYRAAADEYIAHIAEKMGAGIAEAEEKTIWQKIVDFVRNVLRAMGIELNVTEQELSDLLHQAYADLANNMAKAEQTASREAMSAVEEAPSEARQQYDALLEDLTPEEIEAVAQNDFKAAQEAYNAHLANAPKVEPGESSKAYIERKKAYNDELKRLESELNAQQALMDEITAIKAANAPVLTDVEILEQDGFGVDEQHDDVRMSVRYTPTDEQKEAIINSIVNVTGRSREEAERWLASETSLAAMINDDLQYLDYVADPKYKAIKDNSDYPQGTVDFNNICRKRVPFTRMFTRLQRAFPNRVFTADELADIRTIMSKDGLTVACGLCYVEDRRQMVGEVAQSFIDGIQEGFETYANNPTKRKNAEKFKALIGEDAYVPQVYDLTTQEGLDKLYNEHRGIWEAFQAFNNARGQQSQNLLQGYAEYKREILSWSDKKVKQVNDNGGLRIFSYSDFEAHHLIDVVQIIIDCASKGVKIQGYTKVPAFARAVANTGIKLNRSLIPLGDTGLVDGQLAFDPVEGIDINDPDFLESNDNVGNILIGINDEQIRVAMNDPRIHYIIPYHARQKENICQKLNVGAWTNYISTQNERNVSDGKRVKDNINIYTDILTEDITTDRQFVEKYLQLCAEQGRIPKFDQFLDKDAEGNYVYTPGYYKFLIDFKLFDENGNILPQQPVVAEFDDAFNMQILEDYAKDERESTGEQMNETYDKIVDALGLDESAAEGEDVRFSITPQMDADYLAAVEAGDMKTAQRMVIEAARLAMPNTKVPGIVYHGTRSTDGRQPYNTITAGHFTDDYGFAEYYANASGEGFIYNTFVNIERPLVYDFKGQNSDNAVDENGVRITTFSIIDRARKDSNYDGVILKNVDEYGAGVEEEDGEYPGTITDIIPLSPSQIKSADPVTYDDNGNVIPLSERFNPEKSDIRFSARTDEQREALFDAAKARFGLTNNFKGAGYMLPDGSLLDFSEANDGGDPNQRSLDHREIEGIIMDEGREYDSRWMYLADFMNEGAIRLLPEYAGINLMKAPTKEQRQKLFDFIYKYNGEVILEIADERLNNVAYVEYDRRTSPSRIFRDIDGYFNEGIVPEQDVRFSVRTVNQTAQEFHNDALTDFRRQFNLIQPTTVVDVNDRAALAKALGLTPEELSDEKYQLILDGVKDGGRSFYDDDTKRIAIFALENQRTSAEVDENIFHENTHAIVSKNPEVLELGQWLWDNAKSGIRMKTRNSILDSNYPEWQYANEMLSRYTGIILSMGRAGEVLNMLPADQKKHWEFILKEFGYEPEREDGERIRRYDADSRRAGFFRKMSQQKMSDNGTAEKGTRFSSVGITPEVRDEMDRIAATAIIDGNYMLAPNGQPTKLTADQWALVRTGNFKRWFGDWENDPENASKVVDENGEPMVVYHGTNLSVTNKGVPFWTFYEDQHFGTEEQAKELARAGRPEAERKMYEVFLNIRNIKRVPDVPQDWIKNHSEYWEPVFAQAKTEEYDGLVYVNEWEDSDSKSDSYVAFAPSQIKSATDNTGEFSESEDIRFSTRFDVNTNPTEAQKKAGNYKMGHLLLDGYNITIENPKGSVRRGTDSKGNEWKNTLNNDYGYIRGTKGVDGDHIDVYLSDNPAEGNVFVIDQVNPETREFDEHKVMYGFNSEEEARNAYLANFSEGWNGLGTITEVTKDEFRKWIDSSHRKTKPFSEYKSVKTDILDEGDIRYSLVTDPALLERLESEPTIKVYRAMQLIDGKLYPPMSAKVDGKMREPIELGKWEQAEERPDLADEKGYFKLDKGNKTSLKARYNPYFHTSPTPLNDQFASAQARPELVTVEVEVPESELTSGYKAEKAKDSVGKMEWKAGVVQSKLSGTRTVILSRWDKPVRIVPDSEVADVIVKMFEGKDITMPSNVVTPSLRAELEKLGVPFVETDNSGKPMKEDVRFSVVATPTEIEAVKGLSILDAMNISLDHEMTMVKDMIDAERALIKNLQKKNQNPLIEQQIQNAEKRLAANLRQMEILQEVEDQLIDTKHVEPDYQSALSDMEPQTRFEYLSQMFTMRLSPITQTKVTAEDGTETTVRQGGKKKGLMLTPQTLVKDLGWSKSDWKGISYIVSESEGTTIDAIAEMIEQDSEAGYLFAGMDTMQIKDEIIDFLWSMDTYASIRDYIKNERTRKAEEEAEHANEIIDKFIERLESEYGMSADAYNAMIVQQSRAARESWLASVENPNEFAKFEESKDEENGRYTDNQGENRQSISTDGGTEDAAASGEGDSTGEAVQERVPGDSAGNAGSSGPSGNIGRDDSGSKGEGRRDGVVPDDVETSRKSVDEIVENGKQKVVEANAAAADAFMLRLRKINGNLMQLRRAASAQREYDKNTVQIITSLANELLENGALSDMTRGEIKRLLSVIKDSVGKSDLTISVDRLMDIMIGNQLRFGRNRFYDYVKIRDKKVDARGVEVRGKLDVEGQMIMNALREGIGLDAEKLQERISEAEDRLFDTSETIRRNAENDLVGYQIALEYLNEIKASETEEKDLRKELKTAKEEYGADRMTKETYREFVKSTNDAIRENRMQRVMAYEGLLEKMADMIQKSIRNAGQLREAEKQRIEQIQHYANSDMQGMPADEHKAKDSAFWNNPIVRFLFKPLATFDQMLRHFAPKSRSGEGYLWNHFMGGWLKATENEYKGIQSAHEKLDAKAKSVFGNKVKRWSDLFALERKMPKAEISFWDAGEIKSFEVTQGNLLYIYMVNKMTDGKMKLRRMGISEEDVINMTRELDPRFVELADWLQEDFLPGLREKYNAVHEKLFGAPMAAIDNYFPIRVLANARSREVDINIEESNAKPSTITGNIIKRTKNSLALDILGSNAFDVVLGHINDMERWAAFAEWNKDLNTLLSYKKFRNRVQNMSGIYGAGSVVWNNFRSVAEIAAGVYKPATKADSVDKTIMNIAKGVTGAKISFRVYTAFKQLLSWPAFISDANPVILAKNMANPFKAWNWSMENLPLFEKRWKSRQAGDSRLMKTDADWKLWKSKVVEIAGRLGMTPNALVDAVTVAIGARSVYETRLKQYLDYGYDQEKAEEKAKRDATVTFNESQQSNESAFLSQIQMDRTVASVVLTVFRNSSMGYQRMYVDALRNITHMTKRGYKAESIEYMKKQMMRDGLTEAQAERAANRIYSRSFAKNAVQALTFGFIVQLAWNLGPYLPYIFIGDDDEEKKEMAKDAAVRALVGGPVEGMSGGPVLSNISGNIALGEKLSEVNGVQLPLASDMENLFKLFGKDNVRAINEIFNIIVQSGIGVNPQTITDAAVAIVDACNGDLETASEAAICLMRILQVPQSQIEEIYLDEIDFTAEEALDLTIREFAERYARYKVLRSAPLTNWMYDDEQEKEREESYIKRFTSRAEELKRTRGSEAAKTFYEYYDNEYAEMNESLRELKRRAKEAEGAESKAISQEADSLVRTESFQRYSDLIPDIKAYEAYKKLLKDVTDPATREEYEKAMLRHRDNVVNKINGYE